MIKELSVTWCGLFNKSPTYKLYLLLWQQALLQQRTHSQGIFPGAPITGHHQIWFCSSWPSSPAVSPWKSFRLIPTIVHHNCIRTSVHVTTQKLRSYESTWFSKERMTGYCEVLKALSAIASITSCHVPQKGGILVVVLLNCIFACLRFIYTVETFNELTRQQQTTKKNKQAQ